jgi:hypothetical protein
MISGDSVGERTDEQVARFEAALAAGSSLTEAKLEAGYSPHVAKMGRHNMPARLRTIADTWERIQQYQQAAAKLDTATTSALIKGRLAEAIVNAEDSVAVQAAHRLGTHKDYNLFAAESQIGVAVYQVSPRLEQLAAQLASQELPTVDAEPVEPVPPDDVK